MKQHFCTYEQSQTLIELGFNEECFGYFELLNDNKFTTNKYRNSDDYHPAPLKSQAFQFFREKFNILANVYANASGYLFEWHDYVGGTHRGWSEYEGPNDSGVWDSYEEAENACINKLIEITTNKTL